jgi:hypothetical protein
LRATWVFIFLSSLFLFFFSSLFFFLFILFLFFFSSSSKRSLPFVTSAMAGREGWRRKYK